MNKPAPKTFAVKSFGCQMNVYDGERMAELMAGQGLAPADAAEADLVVDSTAQPPDVTADHVAEALSQYLAAERAGASA